MSARNEVSCFESRKNTRTFSEKLCELSKLKKHRITDKGSGHCHFDLGSLRPWDRLSIIFCLDLIENSASPIDIAYMTRRDYPDVLAMVRIIEGMEHIYGNWYER